MSLIRSRKLVDARTIASAYSPCRWFSGPGVPLLSISANPMMELSGVRSSYDTRLTNSDLSLSDASRASLRSRKADSIRKRSVASTNVTSVAPSGSGAIESEMMAPSERSASPHSRRRSGAAAVTVEVTISHTRSRPNRVAHTSAMRLRCAFASSLGSRRQMRTNAALCSFNLPSGPNTATPSWSVSSVAF